MELGISSFAELAPDPETGAVGTPAQRMQDLIEEMELADQVGLEIYALGEHHRPDFVVSSPAVALAAGAARTKDIRLSSAVSVLSSDDPVRVFQQFAELDLISGGRAEIMAGRGSFIESFPLFGYDLDDYDELFSEKLELLLAIRDSEHVTWSGRHRAPIDGLGVYPRPLQDPLPVWIAAGGSPQSVARAGLLGIPLALAIIGGKPEQFAPLFELYRRAAEQGGFDPKTILTATHSHGYVAETTQQAKDEWYPGYAAAMTQLGKERGWNPMTRQQFEASTTMRGATLVGSPEQVAEKILFQHELFGHDRFMLHIGVGHIAHDKVLRSIELFGTEVAPIVRRELAKRAADAEPAQTAASS